MPVQKTDLRSQKKQLDDMRRREKELEIRMSNTTIQQKPLVGKKRTTTPRKTKKTSTLTKPTASSTARIYMGGEKVKAKNGSELGAKTTKKKVETNRTTTVSRKKKLNKPLKEPDLIDISTDKLKDNSKEDVTPFAHENKDNIIIPEQRHTNPFSSFEQNGNTRDIFVGDRNPFNTHFLITDVNMEESNEIVGNNNDGESNSLVNLQNDIILEEEEHTTKEAKHLQEVEYTAEEYYFPEDDDFQEVIRHSEKGNLSDDFPENESESELFQYKEVEIEENRVINGDSYEEGDDVEEDDGVKENMKLEIQEKIRQEIRQDHIREIELRDERSNNDRTGDNDDEVKNMYKGIQSLDDDDSEDSEDEIKDHMTTAERIQLELLEQNQKERELKEIHRSLSRENIFNYDSTYEESDHELCDDEENGDQNAGEERDTRSMILEEMECLKEREKELKRQQSSREGGTYESGEEFELENDFEGDKKINEEVERRTVMEKIQLEMDDLQKREQEMQKKRVYTYGNSRERNDWNGSLGPNEKQDKLTKKPMFGSREDLVKYFGTDAEIEDQKTKKSKRDKQNSVRIPKIFKRMEAEAVKATNRLNAPDHGSIRNKTPDFNVPKTKPMRDGPSRQIISLGDELGQRRAQNTITNQSQPDNKDIVVKKKSIQRGDLLAIEKHKELSPTTTDVKQSAHVAVSPSQVTKQMAQEWERRGEEEKLKKEKIDREIKRKKEEYLNLLQEKAKLEEKQRLQKEERVREYEEKTRQRQLLKQKQQGLNDLWLSRKSLVTIDDNPDIDDQDLLSYDQPKQSSISRSTNNKIQHKESTEEQQEQAKKRHKNIPANTPIQINKTIKKWEKMIQKNNDMKD